jgi:hypothetical protein
MAKNKKKKKVQPAKKATPWGKHSNSFMETCYTAARRILRAMGEDESTFDMFTKHQKRQMFLLTALPPRIAVAPGHAVPRHYIHYIQDQLISCLKNTYFNKEAGVTWMEMATIGQSMLLIFHVDSFIETMQEPQRKIAERLRSAFEEQDIFYKIQENMMTHIKITLMTLSQPNFRIYGQYMDKEMQHTNRPFFHQIIYIVTHECQSLRFKYFNVERTAFRIATGQFMDDVPYTGGTMAMSKIFPGIAHDRVLNIYIQSHAIHRFKERIDTLYPIMRNEYFVISLMMAQQVVRGPNGMQLIACISPVKDGEVIIGYFAFTIDGNNLLVLTLLPLLSNNVPEGHVLYERLHLSKEDLKYLGMDKLSFFYEVDIEQIPILKQILFDELHLDYVHTLYNTYPSKYGQFNEKKTLFVKNFFQKIEERLSDGDENQNIDIIEID